MDKVDNRYYMIDKEEYAEYIEEMGSYKALEDKILDGAINPLVNVVVDLPFELIELLDRLGNQDIAYDTIEYCLRHCIPVLENQSLVDKNKVWMELENKLKFYLTYKKIYPVFENHLHILVYAIGFFSSRMKHIFVKYNVDKRYTMILVNRDKSISKNIEIYLYDNIYDPETGEWVYGE